MHHSGQASRRAIEVQIFGIDRSNTPFSERASVMEFNASEVLLADVRATLRPEDIVGIRCGERKVRHRVIWVGRPSSNQGGQVRLRTIEPMKDLWGDLLPDHFRQRQSALDVTLPGTEPRWTGGNRRNNTRFDCHGRVRYQMPGVQGAAWAKLRDISRGGCYIETPATMPRTSQLSLEIEVDGLQLRTFATVQVCNPGYGMGLQFTDMSEPQREQLEEWISLRE